MYLNLSFCTGLYHYRPPDPQIRLLRPWCYEEVTPGSFQLGSAPQLFSAAALSGFLEPWQSEDGNFFVIQFESKEAGLRAGHVEMHSVAKGSV